MASDVVGCLRSGSMATHADAITASAIVTPSRAFRDWLLPPVTCPTPTRFIDNSTTVLPFFDNSDFGDFLARAETHAVGVHRVDSPAFKFLTGFHPHKLA